MPKKSIAIISGLVLIAAIFFMGFLRGQYGYNNGVLIDLIIISIIWLVSMALIYKILYPKVLFPVFHRLMSTLIVITNFHHILGPVRVLGKYYRWLASGWRPNLLLLPVITVIVWLILIIYAPLAVTPINEELLSTSLDNASHALTNGPPEISQLNKNIATASKAINSASPEINRAAGHLANTSPDIANASLALAEINRTLKNLSIAIGKLNDSNPDILINANRSLIISSKAIEVANRSINNASQSISSALPEVGKANSSINNASIATAGLAAEKAVPHSAKILNNFTGVVLGATIKETTASFLLVIYYYWNIILGLWLLLLFIISAIKARNMMIIEEFVDNTGNAAAEDAQKDDSTDDNKPDGIKPNINKSNDSKSDTNRSDDSKSSGQAKVTAKGLNTMLAARLIYLSKIYSDVDENREILTSARADSTLPATVQVDEIGGLLKGAITPQSTTKLGGFLEIPTTVLMYPLQLLFKGPRIAGSLYNDGGKILLMAQISGWKQPYSWRVCDPERIIEGQDETCRLTENMIAELAYKIFTDLAFDKSIFWSEKWRATWKFSEGLQMYRDCLRTQKDKKLNLKKAEDRFMETLAEDKEFSAAYYNLGVVYTELGESYDESRRFEAAEDAFKRAIDKDRDKWQAYYALGENLFKKNQSRDVINDVINLSNRAIDLRPKAIYMAKALNLRGRAQQEIFKHERDSKYLNKIIESHNKASINALSALMQAVFWDENIKQCRITAAKCLLDLANAYHEFNSDNVKGINEAYYILKEAASISSNDSSIYYQLGRSYFELCEGVSNPCYLEYSIRQFENAIKIEPSKSDYWSYMALASAYKDDKFNLHRASKNIMDNLQSAKSSDLERLKEAYENSNEERRYFIADCLNNFVIVKKLEEDLISSEEVTLESFESLTDRYCTSTNQWGISSISYIYGLKYLEGKINYKDINLLEDIFQNSINLLKDNINEERFLNSTIEKLEFAYIIYILYLIYYYEKELFNNYYDIEDLDRYNYKYTSISEEIPQEYTRLKTEIENIKAYLEGSDGVDAIITREGNINSNPLDPSAHLWLAYTYQYANHYKLARAEYERAYWLDPDDPDTQCNLGYTYINEVLELRDFGEKKKALKKNINYLNNALELYKTSEQKAPTYYWLGRLHYETQEYDIAISNFKIAKAMAYRETFNEGWPLATYYLGRAYLKSKNYEYAEREFKELIESWQSSLKGKKTKKDLINTEIGRKFFFPCPMGVIYIYSYLSLAESYIERDNKYLIEPRSFAFDREFKELCTTARANLSYAKTLIDKIDLIDKLEEKRFKVNLYSKYNDLAGWRLLKRRQNKKAIWHLEASIALRADPKAYLHLAQAYDQEIRDRGLTGPTLTPLEKRCKIERILACCQHVQDMDFNHEYLDQAKKLQDSYQDKGSDMPKDEPVNKKTVKAEITWAEGTKDDEKKGA